MPRNLYREVSRTNTTTTVRKMLLWRMETADRGRAFRPNGDAQRVRAADAQRPFALP